MEFNETFVILVSTLNHWLDYWGQIVLDMTLVLKFVVRWGIARNRRLSHDNFAIDVNKDALLSCKKAHRSSDKNSDSMNELVQIKLFLDLCLWFGYQFLVLVIADDAIEQILPVFLFSYRFCFFKVLNYVL